MMRLLRHLLSIAILPSTITVVVPVWIARRYGVAPALGRSAGELALQRAGVLVAGVGLALFAGSAQCVEGLKTLT